MRGRKRTDLAVERLMALDPLRAAPPRAEPVEPQPSPAGAAAPSVPSAPPPRRIVPAAVVGACVVVVAIAVGAGGRIVLGPASGGSDVAVPDRAGPDRAGPAAVTDRAGETGGRGQVTSPSGTGRPTVVLANGAGGGPAVPVLLVHVVGQVRHPGLVRLAAGSRVADAVTAAGGAGPHADLSGVNLARPVADGEQVRVPAVGEQATTAASGGAAGGSAGPVDLNQADAAALDALPGIGPVMAQRIVDYRNQHGPFRRIDELAEVAGIGERTLERLRPLVRL